MDATTARLLGGFLALALAGCGELAPSPASQLAGTWYFATRNPGVAYTGKIEFDHAGDATSMEITSVNGTEQLVFNGKPYKADNGDYETARATTTLTDGQLCIKALVEHTKGTYEGLTYITVEAAVGFGEMSGLLKIAPPNGDRAIFDFDATRH